MPVKIRLQRRGRKKRPFYHIVVADSRAPRDGRFIEKLGTYNPMTKPATIEIDRERAYDWLMKGAQPTDTARAILRFKGVLYMKHLQRGVAKGAITQDQADQKLTAWLDDKDEKIAKRVAASAEERAAFLAQVSGVPAPPPAAEEVPALDLTPESAPAAEEPAEAVEAEATDTVTPEADTQEVAAEATPVEEQEKKIDEGPPAIQETIDTAKQEAEETQAADEAPVAEEEQA